MTKPTKWRNYSNARHEYGIVRSPIRRITGMGAKVRLLFPKKIQPCLTRDSNLNPLGCKPSVRATILAGPFPNIKGRPSGRVVSNVDCCAIGPGLESQRRLGCL
ncbi:hypothetical protein TNCV_4263991 [Trichonephila clavipes]|nr:hypothetical protein TNCV_4263991 [Trichonephila clavipes]